MQYLKFVAVVFVLYFLGYVLGPTLSPMLISERTETNSSTALVDYKGAQYKINLAEIRDGDLPTTVEITKVTKIPTLSGEGKVILQKGDTVTLLNRKDTDLIVEKADANGKGLIKASHTDLFVQLAKQIYDKEAGQNSSPIAANTPMTKPTPAPTPKPAPAPAPVAKVDATPTPAPTPAPTPMAKPEPTPAAGGTIGPEQIVTLMKESIAGGAVKEFKTDQVKGWKAGDDETIDGTDYQTGLAAYEATTIFGIRPVQAKALIKSGKIERWVYAKSGMEIQ